MKIRNKIILPTMYTKPNWDMAERNFIQVAISWWKINLISVYKITSKLCVENIWVPDWECCSPLKNHLVFKCPLEFRFTILLHTYKQCTHCIFPIVFKLFTIWALHVNQVMWWVINLNSVYYTLCKENYQQSRGH